MSGAASSDRVMIKKPSARLRAIVANVSLSFGTPPTSMGPVGLHTFAEYFLSAAKSVQAPDTAPTLPVVRTFLVCHSLELSLKAFLSLKGCSLLELAGGVYGHDLASLIKEAEQQDLHALVKLENHQRSEIISASTYYREKLLEYPSVMETLNGYAGLPDADLLIDFAEELVVALREPCLVA